MAMAADTKSSSQGQYTTKATCSNCGATNWINLYWAGRMGGWNCHACGKKH
jgi:transposase